MLYIMFDAAKPGLLVFLNVPMALSGGLLAQVCRNMNLSVTAGVGFIALFGIAVMNGVVLVSTIRQMEMAWSATETSVNPGCPQTTAPGFDDGPGCFFRFFADGFCKLSWRRGSTSFGDGRNRRTCNLHASDFVRASISLCLDEPASQNQ